jgi:hypothetical protein
MDGCSLVDSTGVVAVCLPSPSRVMVHRYPLPWSVHFLHTIWHAAIVLYSLIAAVHINLSPKDSPATGPGGIYRYFASWYSITHVRHLSVPLL